MAAYPANAAFFKLSFLDKNLSGTGSSFEASGALSAELLGGVRYLKAMSFRRCLFAAEQNGAL